MWGVLSSELETKNTMIKTLYTLLAILITSHLSAQTPSGIEAAEYDPIGERWFVSCGSSTLLSTSDLGESWDYFGNANASYGMEVMNGALFVIYNNQIFAYDLNTAELLGTESITGADFLNGMGNDGNGTLIISDFSTGRIIKIDSVVAKMQSIEVSENSLNFSVF